MPGDSGSISSRVRLVPGQKGEHKDTFGAIHKQGFVRARVDGQILELSGKETPELKKTFTHNIEAIVDRIVIKPEIRSRLADSIETALRLSQGLVLVTVQQPDGSCQDTIYSEKFACPEHPSASLPELEPRLFSFISPHGACSACHGLGTVSEFDPDMIVSDENVSLENGAIEAWRKNGKRMNIYYSRVLRQFCKDVGVSYTLPYKDVPKKLRDVLMYGTDKKGDQGTGSSVSSVLNAQSSVLPVLPGYSIDDVSRLTVAGARQFFEKLRLSEEGAAVAEPIVREISARLGFMFDVGLGYLTLDRKTGSLSGGEAQRIRLATQVGSGLVGVCYVLDEPTIGLHQRDNARLIRTLKRLQSIGNTVLMVEHDEDCIRSADYLIDIGPGAGAHGGNVVCAGPVPDVFDNRHSLTIKYLTGEYAIATPEHRRPIDLDKNAIEIKGCRENNLKNIDVRIPLGGLICVTGVSGSGKSTLVNQTLLPALKRKLYGSRIRAGGHKQLIGVNKIDKVIEIDQSPIGRSPRSHPGRDPGAVG